jgi:hypothetical protein
MVWPLHCEIGTWGHNVHADVRAAYSRWEDERQFIVRKVPKGMNPWTEHYSALMAEVPDADDPRSQLNRSLLDSLDRAELILIAGQAGSHCVKATVEHLAEHLPGRDLSRLVLLTDCMSPVAGFEDAQATFQQRMRDLGIQAPCLPSHSTYSAPMASHNAAGCWNRRATNMQPCTVANTARPAASGVPENFIVPCAAPSASTRANQASCARKNPCNAPRTRSGSELTSAASMPARQSSPDPQARDSIIDRYWSSCACAGSDVSIPRIAASARAL